MAEVTTLADDEFVAVINGIQMEVPSEFQHHPRIAFVSVNGESNGAGVVASLPVKTKIFILTEFVPHKVYHHITARAREVRGIYLHKKNTKAIIEAVKSYFPEFYKGDNDKKEKREWAGHGRIQEFLTKNPPDLSKPSAEEARRLFAIAMQEGLTTTFGSLAQAISQMKRKKGMGEIPASARKKDVRAEALQILDEAISNLTFIRDYVAATSTENEELKTRILGLRKVLGVE